MIRPEGKSQPALRRVQHGITGSLLLLTASLGFTGCAGRQLGSASTHGDDLVSYKYVRLVEVPQALRERILARLRECRFVILSEQRFALLSQEERSQFLNCTVSWSLKGDDLDETVWTYDAPGTGVPPEQVTVRRSTMVDVRVTVVLRDPGGRTVYKGSGRETGKPGVAFASAMEAALAGLVAARRGEHSLSE